MKNVILISTTTVEERSKTGKKLVYYIAELQNINQRKVIEEDSLSFNYIIKSVDNNELEFDDQNNIVGKFIQTEYGQFQVPDIDYELPEAKSIEEIQQEINSLCFLDYCNKEKIYDLIWEKYE